MLLTKLIVSGTSNVKISIVNRSNLNFKSHSNLCYAESVVIITLISKYPSKYTVYIELTIRVFTE
ncbi:hypothetical protein DI53_0183 [Sphingobacterium deserti]|uniref:Uncharacterized protein n=1 Tax=Sphingobacterium deserti TaxID=1229276 RepID=A0A0B8T5R7_9SPHI|nr:hypothetical protein DI53_0183 [Sphingobacterium deserti]